MRRESLARRLQGSSAKCARCVLGQNNAALSGNALFPGCFLHERARLERLPPGAFRSVPGAGLAQPLVEPTRRRPAELLRDLRGVEEVPAIVARAVRDD